MSQPVSSKIRNAVRIDRAFRLVWRASPSWTLLNGALVLVQGVFPLLSLYLLKLIVDTITETVQSGGLETGISKLIMLIGAAAVVALAQAGTTKLADYSAEAQSTIVTDFVYDTMHRKSVDLDLAYYEDPNYFDTLHRAQQEGPYRPTRIVNGLNRLGQSGMSLVAMVGLLFTFHWSAGVLLFASALPGVLVQIVFSKKMYHWQQQRTSIERKADYYSWLMTADASAKELRLFDLGGFFSETFNCLRGVIRGEKLALSRQRAIADFVAQACAIIILMACFLLIGFRTIKGLITIGDMVMYFQAFQRGLSSLKELLHSIAGLYEDNLFVAHFFSFLDVQNTLVEPTEPEALPPVSQRGITLTDLHFRYPGQAKPVLSGLSLTIKPGEVVALVGANGAGKSTLVKLLCRLYDPEQGNIAIEGTDLRNLALSDVRRQISVVFQDFVKYHLSVRENIGLGDIKRLDDVAAIATAANRAGAEELIQNLPNCYETILGRWFIGGVELSQGEWQKIVIARAFFRDARLVILDEPTSSLDGNTEYHLYLKFKELMAGRSALLISHRFSTVSMADRICVLHDGRIVEDGTHKELMTRNGIYADMYTKQSIWMEDLERKG
ncbi:ABC transporter ATP-binding protein [Desulfofustis glycolicus]|uniref:ATP-binding cassette, subfamily B n=1 Tax=Desulfofustis glycolicus DSM 9705 TaxID=1121409 RepID=A0A1M5YNU8_9BACT|nr:ABC transporter ATP-binding protein [Desulfofustis glycolicus]SHI13549.1 ATP-binding cassette, subfamily B [Desulfofustis glycolicus DSM 9705]